MITNVLPLFYGLQCTWVAVNVYVVLLCHVTARQVIGDGSAGAQWKERTERHKV